MIYRYFWFIYEYNTAQWVNICAAFKNLSSEIPHLEEQQKCTTLKKKMQSTHAAVQSLYISGYSCTRKKYSLASRTIQAV